MPELWKDLSERLGSVVTKWTAYAAFGSALLYLLGYLTLRFQLSAYGVATNLDVFDEKYFFAGCRFLVYLLSTIPNILILALILAGAGYLPFRFISVTARRRFNAKLESLYSAPLRLPLLGIVLAVGFIQFVMRRCFSLGNLLLQPDLPDRWITSILLSTDSDLALYFSSLVAAFLLTACILLFTWSRQITATPASQILTGTLGFLTFVEFLMLPVNYGTLVATQQLPRLMLPGLTNTSAPGQRNWLVWDSKNAITYLTLTPDLQKSLVTAPKKEMTIQILGYDDILCILFAPKHPNSSRCSQ